MSHAYPLTFDVDYPDRPLNRLTTALRLFMAVPIVARAHRDRRLHRRIDRRRHTTVVASGSALLFLPPLLMVVFRGRYPRWWYEFNVELLRFSEPRRRLPRAHGRPLPVDRGAAERLASTSRTRPG